MPRCRGQAGRRRYQKNYESKGQRPNPFSELFGRGGGSAHRRGSIRWRPGWGGHGFASLGAENDILMLSGLHQCELPAVMDNRMGGDGLWGLRGTDRVRVWDVWCKG